MISLPKTLQGTAYTLHFVTEIVGIGNTLVVAKLTGYQSVGHYNDGFMPMVGKIEAITDVGTYNSVTALYFTNVAGAIGVVEAYLVGSVPYYSGGSVV